MTDFFTSDTHFGHVNILRHCDRPWSSVEEMNDGLVEAWNARVNYDDTVFHLGDFAMGQKVLWPGYRARLSGRIILIRGNHDDPEVKILAALSEDAGDEIHDEYLYSTGRLRIHLAHYPGLEAYDDGRGYIRHNRLEQGCTHKFCGHVHNMFVERAGYINVGVDVRGFQPVTLEEILGRNT